MGIGEGFAHAKTILIGEHSVVYNHPAISIGIPVLTTRVSVVKHDIDWVDSSLYTGPLKRAPKNLGGLSALVVKLRETLDLPPLKITIESIIPVSSGLGSSAAVSSALVEACYAFKGVPLDSITRFDLTQFSEKITHGNPSGIDSLTVFSNDALYYVKGKPVESIKVDLDGYLVVAYSGIESDTFKAVDWVRKNSHKKTYQDALTSLGILTKDARTCIKNKDSVGLGQLFNDAHKALSTLELSHPLVDKMIEDAISLGALGAKLSGGGLGGIMIALMNDSASATKVVEVFKKQYTNSVWVINLKR